MIDDRKELKQRAEADNETKKQMEVGFVMLMSGVFTGLILLLQYIGIWGLLPVWLVVIEAMVIYVILYGLFSLREYLVVLSKRIHDLENKSNEYDKEDS